MVVKSVLNGGEGGAVLVAGRGRRSGGIDADMNVGCNGGPGKEEREEDQAGHAGKVS